MITSLDLGLVLAGFLVGSAVSAGAARYAEGKDWQSGRSASAACGCRLAWLDLLPLLRWIGRGGRCRTCRSPIGINALVWGFAGALTALMAVFLAPPGTLILTAIFGWLLLALAAVDLRTFLLPDPLTLAVLLSGATMVVLTRPGDWPWHVGGAVAGYLTLWGVETAYRQLRGVDGLGRGDAKLFGAIGMWTGLLGLPIVLLIASLAGIAAALLHAAITRISLSGSSAIAFGPWLALGGYTVWLIGDRNLLTTNI